MKKASESATLCGMYACLMVYGKSEAHVMEVWSSVPKAASVLERFKAIPRIDIYKKMTNLEGFLHGYTLPPPISKDPSPSLTPLAHHTTFFCIVFNRFFRARSKQPMWYEIMS
uniref:MADS-box domain-containing protein n=1 Tax=Leersia perrieri TaxID=77586 RepID=A0A0D9XPA1_9ORYZ